MKRYQQGVLLGLVLSVLLGGTVVLFSNEERRRQLQYRLKSFRNALPDGKQLKQSAQQAAQKAQEAGSQLGEQVQESASKLGQRTQDMTSAAWQKVTALGANVQAKSTHVAKELNHRA